MTTEIRKMKLDYIIAPIDNENFDADDPDGRYNDDDLFAVALSLGWDCSDCEVIHQLPSEVGSWINSNCARKRVHTPKDAEGFDASWISCLVVSFDEMNDWLY